MNDRQASTSIFVSSQRPPRWNQKDSVNPVTNRRNGTNNQITDTGTSVNLPPPGNTTCNQLFIFQMYMVIIHTIRKLI